MYIIVEYIYECAGRAKIRHTRKNTQGYYTLKLLINYFVFNCFIFYAGKAKQTEKYLGAEGCEPRTMAQLLNTAPEKASVANLSNRSSLQYKITNCPNTPTILQVICTLFARYLYSYLCIWIINRKTVWWENSHRYFFICLMGDISRSSGVQNPFIKSIIETSSLVSITAIFFLGNRNANFENSLSISHSRFHKKKKFGWVGEVTGLMRLYNTKIARA